MNVRGYGRTSTDDQSGFSLPAQKRACEEWAKANGHTWAGWFYDDDLSGKREDRPKFQALINAAKDDPGSIVIVHKFDRLARDTEILLRIVYKELRRVRVLSVTESIDLYTPLGKVMFTMQGSLSTFHVDNLSLETRKGLHEKAEQGGWVGLPPFGYRSVHELSSSGEKIKGTHRIVPTEDAEIVKEIFNLYATGNHSTLSIAEMLNRRGATLLHPKTHLRIPWTADNVRGVLQRPAYIGRVSCAGIDYEGKHEPIIDLCQWHAVQSLFGRRTKSRGRAPVRVDDPLLLTEIAYCAECGAAMHAHRSGNKTRKRYYRCKNRRDSGRDACGAGITRADLVDEYVLDLVRRLSIGAPIVEAVIREAHATLNTPPPAATDTAKIKEQLRRLKAMYLAGDADLDDLSYHRQRTALEAQLIDQSPQPVAALDTSAVLALLSSMASIIAVATPAEQRAIVQQLFSAVWIKPGEVEAVDTTPTWGKMYDCVSGAISAGLDTALDTSDAMPPRWKQFRIAA